MALVSTLYCFLECSKENSKCFLSFENLERLRDISRPKIAVLPGQTEKNENAKAEKMHRPGTMNESFLIQSDFEMTVNF